VTDREPEIYTDEELKKFFNACGPRWPAEQILFRTWSQVFEKMKFG